MLHSGPPTAAARPFKIHSLLSLFKLFCMHVLYVLIGCMQENRYNEKDTNRPWCVCPIPPFLMAFSRLRMASFLLWQPFPLVFVAHIVDGRNCTRLPHVLQRLDEASKKMYQSCICQVWWVGGGVLKASCYLQILSLIVHDSTDSTLLSHFIHFSTAFLGHDDSGINIKLDTCLTNFKDNAIIVSGAPEDKSKFVLVTEINLQVSCKIVRLP